MPSTAPTLALTIGDPGGVGPEIAVRLASSRATGLVANLVLVGDTAVVRAAAKAADVSLSGIEIVGSGGARASDFAAGVVGARRGHASYRYLEEAIALASAGTVEGVVTGPISKAAWHMAGHQYPGQTEVLAERTGTRDFAMMLAAGTLRSVLVTTHMSLRQVLDSITTATVASTIRLADRYLSAIVGRRPRLALAGLNPHAGEAGAFGVEDDEILRPAVSECQADGIDVVGPVSGDTVFVQAHRGVFDAVISCFHDQGLIPVKLLGFDHGVNVTLGLPFPRTSPDHGTAFDIAGTGAAHLGSTSSAIVLASKMARSAKPGGVTVGR